MKLADLSDRDLDYLEGFISKCASKHVDPETVLQKQAGPTGAALRPALSELMQSFKGVGRAAVSKAAPALGAAAKAVRPITSSVGKGFNAFTGQAVSDLTGAQRAAQDYIRRFSAAGGKPSAKLNAMQQAQEKIKGQLAAAKENPVYQFSSSMHIPQGIEGLRSGIRSHPILAGMTALGGGSGLHKMLGTREPENNWYTGRYRENT